MGETVHLETAIMYDITSQPMLRIGSTACGRSVSDVDGTHPATRDGAAVTCLSCRRTKVFRETWGWDDLDRLEDRRRSRRYKGEGFRAFYERLAVDIDRYMRDHGECWRSRRIAERTMRITARRTA
jgi:hypothetical protein